MAFSIHEHFESGESRKGTNDDSNDVAYIIVDDGTGGAVDDDDAQAWAEANVPAAYNYKPRADLQGQPLNDRTWLFKATYSTNVVATNDQAFTFNTGGGSQQAIRSKFHRATYKPSGPGTSPYDNWINPDSSGGANGTTIDTSAFEFQITDYVAPANMTSAYVSLLYHLTDTVNANTFALTVQGVPCSFDPGSCRFKGATGSKRGLGDWEINLSFTAQPNETSFAIPGFTTIAFKGQDYLSFVYEKATQADDSNKFIAPKLTHVLVDQMYPDDNWTGLI